MKFRLGFILLIGAAISFTSVYAGDPVKPEQRDVEGQAPATPGKQAEATTASVDTTSDVTLTSSEIYQPQEPPISDPLEPFNRVMFTFNDKIDIYIMKPIATIYNKIMPKPLNAGIHNAFINIDTITTIINDLLQLHIGQTANDIWRFAINSTVGIGGLFDIGERIGLVPYTNDFGLTLARWGWRHSTYLVLPFFGPNSIRDTFHVVVDYGYLSIYPYIYPYKTRYAVFLFGAVDSRAQLLKFESVLEEAALDQYVFLRSAYDQRRNFQIEENLSLGFTKRNNAFAES